ncbi:MAG TPA: cadherin domain-containing protein [Planctomycetota bacterium]|nr:cadherin domain-containing protein [Planctomycetota bacterium]
MFRSSRLVRHFLALIAVMLPWCYSADYIASSFPPAVQGLATQGQVVAVDAAGNRYLTGFFTWDSDFNPGRGEDSRTASTYTIFVTRYNSDDSYAWTQTFAATGPCKGQAIAVDGSTVYVTGTFSGTGRIGGTTTDVTAQGTTDAIILALNTSDGTAKSNWGISGTGVQTFGGATASGNGIAVSGSTVFVCGVFTGSAKLATSAGTVSADGTDAFIAAVNASDGLGVSGWGIGGKGAQTFGGNRTEYCYGVAADSTHVYVTGTTYTPSPRIGGTANSVTTSSTGDVYVFALNASDGSRRTDWGIANSGIQWFGPGSDAFGHAIALDGSSVYVAGSYGRAGAGIAGAASPIPFSALTDAFVFALNKSDGAAKSNWGLSGCGVQTLNGDNGDAGYGVLADGTCVYAIGSFSLSAEIGTGGAQIHGSGVDAFVLALNASDGQPVSNWATDGTGVQLLSGSDHETGYAIAGDAARLYAYVQSFSDDAGTAGLGFIEGNGIVLFTLDRATGNDPLPILTSPNLVGTVAGAPINYLLTATNNPMGFSATGLPAGLTLTGNAITGSVLNSGLYNATIAVTNSVATSYSTITFRVIEDDVSFSVPPSVSGIPQHSQSLAIDAAGNRYLAGAFSGAIDFNPGTGVDLKTAACRRHSTAYVTRFNADGSYAWTQIIGSKGQSLAHAIATNGTAVFVAGDAYGQVSVGATTGFVDCPGRPTAFVAALDAATGQARSNWGVSGNGIQTFQGRYSNAYGVAIQGLHLYVTGAFSSKGRIGSSRDVTWDADLSPDTYVLALNASDGQPRTNWGLNNTGVQVLTGNCTGRAVATDETGIYLAGYFSSSIRFAPAAPSVNGIGFSDDVFVAALDLSTGARKANWGVSGTSIQTFAGSGTDRANGICVDQSAVYVSGDFEGSATLGGGATIASAGSRDAFAIALEKTTGAARANWGRSASGVQTFGGTGYDLGNAIATSGIMIHFTGEFTGTAQLGAAGSSITSAGSNDAFMVSLLALDGAPAPIGILNSGIQTFGGAATEIGTSVAAHSGNLYVYGRYFSFPARLNGTGSTFRPSSSNSFLLTLDVNLAPTDIALSAGSVPENAASGTTIGVLSASDPDVGESFTYSLVSGAGSSGNAFFSIQNATLKSAGVFDFETQSSYSIRVRVSDAHNATYEKAFTINVTNQNESPTVAPQTFTIAENSPAGSAVGAVVAADPDAGQALTYAITAGNASGAFAINASSGAITIASPSAVNFETSPTFSLLISVSDNFTPPLSASATMTVQLADVNEPPVLAARVFSITENSSFGTVVGTVTGSDADAGQTLAYTIIAGNTGGAFAVDAPSGRITVANSSALNFEATASFRLTINATDDAAVPLSVPAAVSINLINVNEAAPEITSIVVLPEPLKAGEQALFVVAASDVDGNDLSYLYDYGDGTSDNLGRHVYARPGAYEVRVKVSDGTFTSSGSIVLLVGPGVSGVQGDSDGDGVSDKMESLLGTSANDATSRPPGATEVLVASDLRVSLNFKTGKDKLTLGGSMNLPAETPLKGTLAVFEVGGVAGRIFTGGALKLSPPRNNGPHSFKLNLSQRMQEELAQYGLVNGDSVKTVTIPACIYIQSRMFRTELSKTYIGKEKAGKGTIK